jgi:hypothetical protein
MKRLTLRVALVAALGMGATMAHADSFTYHGSLTDAGRPANGTYDIQLTLYSSQSGGRAIAGPVTLYGVPVREGSFSTMVDFGQSATADTQGWVDVKVKPAGGGDFVALNNRSPVEPTGTCPGTWNLDGNAAIPGGSYLGTSDANNLVFSANGIVSGEFSATDNAFYTFYATSLSNSDGASGTDSLAAGYHGRTLFEGSFNWSPQFGTLGQVPDTANEQFIINAPHGVGINTATAADGTPLRDELTIAPSPDLPAGNADFVMLGDPAFSYKGFNFNVQANGYYQMNGLYFDGATLFYDSMLFINYIHASPGYGEWNFNGASGFNPITVGTNSSSGNGAFLSGAGVWTNASSRTFKEAFTAIDAMSVLNKLVALPVQTWFYKGNHDDGAHMGPVAEDFAQAFGLGSNEKYIGTVDESGVALAAIQGLNQKVETENATLKHENAELRSKLDAVAARLDRLETRKGE